MPLITSFSSGSGGFYTFGWTPADVTSDTAGNIVADVPLTVWTTAARTEQVTELFHEDGVTMIDYGIVRSDESGRFGFVASDAFTVLYVWPGYGPAWPVLAHEVLDSAVARSAEAVASASAAQSAAESAAADTAASLTSGRAVAVWDYGVVGDGTTDDTAAVQAAITAAGAGGTVSFNQGTFGQKAFRCGPLTMLDYQTWDGGGSSKPGAATPHLTFPGLTAAQVAITTGNSCTLRGLRIKGPGSTVGTVTGTVNAGSTQRFENVSWTDFNKGVTLTNVYYGAFVTCEFARNATGLTLSGCYNLPLFGCRFHCLDGTTFGTAIAAGDVSGMNVYGGSIEGWSTAVTLGNGADVGFYGTYWETTNTTGAVGISAATANHSAITVIGNLVYLNGVDAWIILPSNQSYNALCQGNKFRHATGTTTPTAYRLGTIGANTQARLGPDGWSEVSAAANYDDNPFTGAGTVRGVTLYRPIGTPYAGMTFQGSAQVRPIATKSTNYTVVTTDELILTSAGVTITLPSVANVPRGRSFIIKNISAATTTVQPVSGTIDGAATKTLAQWEKATFASDGGNWITV